jgi:hypothetical protein
MINKTVNPKRAAYKDAPDTRAYSQGHNPPTIHHETDIPDAEEEAAAAKVTFSGIRLKKRKETTTPEGTPEHTNLVAGTELIRKRGILDTSHLGKKMSKYVSVVRATFRVPRGNVKELVMELLFMGLNTLLTEDETVCYLHPNNPSQQAKKRQDMPPKFQQIHSDWMVFDQNNTWFKNYINEGGKRTYNVFFWLGGEQPAQKILDACILEWDKTRLMILTSS